MLKEGLPILVALRSRNGSTMTSLGVYQRSQASVGKWIPYSHDMDSHVHAARVETYCCWSDHWNLVCGRPEVNFHEGTHLVMKQHTDVRNVVLDPIISSAGKAWTADPPAGLRIIWSAALKWNECMHTVVPQMVNIRLAGKHHPECQVSCVCNYHGHRLG